MCLILMAYKKNLDFPFIFAANRDEFYERPTRVAGYWEERPDILAGRDLRDGGTWLGITRGGRFAALTNFRDLSVPYMGAPSRGELVSGFLMGESTTGEYLSYLKENGKRYNGFSLIFGRIHDLGYYCNRDSGSSLLPGVHGLSNAFLDVPWPKVRRGLEEMGKVLKKEKSPQPESLFNLLSDRTTPEDDHLPHTGVGLEWERILSPLFIASPVYGTRSATVIIIDRHGHVLFEERTFDREPQTWTAARFDFTLGEAQ